MDDVLLNDSQTLGNCGFTNQTARPQAPATVGLAFRLSDDSFEQLRIEPFSTPPELPDVMKPQDSGSTANEQALLQSTADMGAKVLHTGTTTSRPQEEETAEPWEQLDAVDSAAVKYIADLLQSSKSRARMAGRARLSLSHTVLLSLTLLSKRVSYRSVSRRFHLEKGNIHRIFFSFCERVNMLEEKQIRWPVGREAVEALFPLFSPEDEEGVQKAPQVLGVLGCTQIPIRLPIGKHDVESTVAEVKRMKKEAHPDSWLNLELVCDHTGHFLHCRISKGSDMDRGITLRDKLKQHPELMPPGSCLVARAGYPLTTQILTPYTRSHSLQEELFNKTLEEHFQILDQAVANLRTRFQRLRYLDIGNYERARAVVLTACVLHNVFLDMGQVIQGEVKKEEPIIQEGEGEVDDEGVCRRDAISDLLFKSFDSERT
uniref:DDE Tnp4 domain-containing protein n=1 Tax=Monopterus albus TaxID=43700 RepID=A0A3Q3IWY8_MONAL